MAPQSKKNSKTSSKKRPTVRKTPAKKKPKKKKRNSFTLKKGFFIFVGIFFIVSLMAFAYFLGQEKYVASAKNSYNTTSAKIKEVQKIKKHEVKPKISKMSVPKKEKQAQVALARQGIKPKLVIIIDDVHTKAQIKEIKALGMKVTPSIFPPYKLSPDSHRLAQDLKHYMIHLPMESGNKQFNKQYKTLKISFSNKKIENRIKELRILFPKARYINNHTGSVFTSDYSSMNLAYKIMKENGFTFIDSRTVNTSKVREIAYSYGDVYVARDIFIDNKHTVHYIHKQLKKAVDIAKRKGYAVAIGHPHQSTMQALSTADDILNEVELMYIDELYR